MMATSRAAADMKQNLRPGQTRRVLWRHVRHETRSRLFGMRPTPGRHSWNGVRGGRGRARVSRLAETLLCPSATQPTALWQC